VAIVGPGETAGKSGDVSPVRGVRGGTESSAGLKIPIRSHYGPIAFKFAKYAIFTLLAINMVLFMAGKPLNEGLDSFGWLLFLGVFEYESGSLDQKYAGPWEKYALLAVQVVGYAIAVKVTITYALTEDWLDFVNSSVWLIVCVSIGYDMYAPGEYGGAEWRVRNIIKIMLYVTLAAIAISWGVEGDWLAFYDASLWILCFAIVELNIFTFEEREDSVES
jgi:hypothetical protein